MKNIIACLTAALYLSACSAVPQRLACEQFKPEHQAECGERNAEIDKKAAEVEQDNGTKVALGIGALLLIGIAAAAGNRTTTYKSSTYCSRGVGYSSCSTRSSY